MARILVADDYPTMCRLCQVNLERAGHTVTAVLNGNVAFEILQTLPYDLVISDMIMPVCDGLQLYAKMRGDASTKNIPFLLFAVSYNHHTPEQKQALNAALLTRHAPMHRAYFLVKPFNPSRMVLLVTQILNGAVPDGAFYS
ncbi:MAG: response regulator [Akkermansiaceae bacterium]|nr:response regulator [Armatimonadota bacterium]